MNKWNKKRVFVSGGAGVIGTALVNQLIDQGADIFVGDLQPPPPLWIGHLRYRQGDLVQLTYEEIQDFSPEVYFHLAATFERSEESKEFWDENFHHNVILSHQLMTLLKNLPSLKQVVFASSYLIYNPSLYLFNSSQLQTTALDEMCAMAPRNLCGMAKLQHESELSFLRHFYPHLQTICARIFRSYGKNSRDIISRWIRTCLKGDPLTIYRQEGVFDFIYADDVAQGLLRLSDSHFNGIVNLGSGHARSISDVIAILKRHFPNISLKYESSNIPYEASQANMQRFYELTQWNQFRPIDEVIPELIHFEKQKKVLHF